jgi:hypothetical protein
MNSDWAANKTPDALEPERNYPEPLYHPVGRLICEARMGHGQLEQVKMFGQLHGHSFHW